VEQWCKDVNQRVDSGGHQSLQASAPVGRRSQQSLCEDQRRDEVGHLSRALEASLVEL
jgi:hypothetical protein